RLAECKMDIRMFCKQLMKRRCSQSQDGARRIGYCACCIGFTIEKGKFPKGFAGLNNPVEDFFPVIIKVRPPDPTRDQLIIECRRSAFVEDDFTCLSMPISCPFF